MTTTNPTRRNVLVGMCALAASGLTGLFEISAAEAASAIKVRKDGKVDVTISALAKNGAVLKLPTLNAALVRVSATKYVAYSLKCTHEGGPVDATTWTCAWHGAQFDSKTGAATRMPATRALTKLKVAVAKGIATVG